MSLGRFSVFSRSGDFGRIFRLPGDGGRGRHVAAMTRMGARVWAALSLGTPPGLMGLETPPGTKARDTVAVLEVTPEGGASNTVARVPHGLWERGPDTRSFELIRDEHAAWATIAGGGGRLFVATFGGDSLEVSAYRAGDGMGRIVPTSGRAGGVAAARPARDAREPGGIVVDRGKGGRIHGVSCVWGVGGWVGPAGEAYLPRDGPDSGRVRGQGCFPAFRRVGPGDGGGCAGGGVICWFLLCDLAESGRRDACGGCSPPTCFSGMCKDYTLPRGCQP